MVEDDRARTEFLDRGMDLLDFARTRKERRIRTLALALDDQMPRDAGTFRQPDDFFHGLDEPVVLAEIEANQDRRARFGIGGFAVDHQYGVWDTTIRTVPGTPSRRPGFRNPARLRAQ